MNIHPRSFSIAFLSFASLCLLLFRPASGDLPQLGLSLVPANHQVELTLTGEAGAVYTIETSMNLSNWFPFSTGIAMNRALTVRHDAATNSASFYRGRAANALLPPLTVVPKADTNLSDRALASPSGVSTVIYGNDGIRFTLTLPTNSVPDATIITMTLVTNITGLPFARGILCSS